MKRYVFTAASLMSLLLCLAVLVLSAWSFWTAFVVTWKHAAPGDEPTHLVLHVRTLALTRGMVMIQDSEMRPGYVDAAHARAELAAARAARAEFHGFAAKPLNLATYDVTNFAIARYARRVQLGTVRERALLVPCWAIAVASALLPAYWGRARRRERTRSERLTKGLCVACGYDLRGSPARCPECGAAAVAQQQPAAGVAASPAD